MADMVVQILLLIAGTAADLLSLALLARFIMQWQRLSFRNPLGQFVVAVTDWAVRPVRRLVPGLFGLDWASLLLAWLAQCMVLGLAAGLTGAVASPAAAGLVALAAAVALLRLCIYLAMGVVLMTVIFSWVNPYAPMAPFFNALARPLLRPFQRVLPPVGGVDLSPIALMLVLTILLMLLPGGARSSIL